ncbi:hypothetical protein NBRC116583_05610 [Arenicella sp. 4NH20-0111]|uniref:ion channel n=1 Tax=Arenicella sp. 4NH20-0111 TaxID=3127648 RepID=UPI003103E2F7
MSHSEAMNGGFGMMFAIASFITSFILPAEISVILLIIAYPMFITTVGLMIGNNDGWYGEAISFFVMLIVATVAIFAVIYWRYGLLANGEHIDISILESIYFSITTWTTLGYGDFAPIPRIRHITSIQAIMGYVGLGLWVGLMSGYINNLNRLRSEINEHNAKLFKSIEDENKNS